MARIIRWHLDTAYQNYNYLLIDSKSAEAVVVDPFDAAKTEEKLAAQHAHLVGILITHAHGDHCCGVAGLLKQHQVPVYAHKSNARALPYMTHGLEDGDNLDLTEEIKGQALATPGHISGHMTYYFPDLGAVFAGDTLFNAGAGNVRHPSASVDELYDSLQKLKTLPDHTVLHSGHDYFINNVRFSRTIVDDPYYDILLETLAAQTHEGRKVATLGEEKRYNLFLKTDDQAVQAALAQICGQKLGDSRETFRALRQQRDKW